MRSGQRGDLARVGRISKDFLIAGDGGIENYLTCGMAGGANGLAFEDGPVCQSQHRRCSHFMPLLPVPWNFGLAVPESLYDLHMHKAGGVLVEHPPALCGLTRYSDYGQKCKDPYRPCPRQSG